MLGELIELRVAASNRDCYAAGALAAAKYLVGKPAGLYSMNDVLGLS
jgi:4-hydroxy-tetrahydrodipicolinate reductase